MDGSPPHRSLARILISDPDPALEELLSSLGHDTAVLDVHGCLEQQIARADVLLPDRRTLVGRRSARAARMIANRHNDTTQA